MDRVEQIVQLVSRNPGIRYSEIMRETGLANGVLSHHLFKIEQAGKITIERTPRVARVYPCGIPEEETTVIKHLRSSTSRKILTVLLDGSLSFKDIVSKVKKSQGTVSLVLKGLSEDGIVERKLVNGDLMFQLTNKALLDTLIERQPTFIENSANNISDIFSSI
ncbi:winged helix-turn-helix transcriptional regulator [Candidatus Nitrosotenuis cloacae]|uniref:winged helix-turn-helix transcriptional regulator n=1 Tax=Candidatus Nitrosotenuis cloacae TaxID=1603555 RepID=UPI00227F1BEA|nr:ArsR family transcriptional regulator [Candidatus Nitrosotenuis cloacae]